MLQGLSARQIALAMALGLVIGCFPVLGTTTALCALAAWRFGANQLVIQVGNYLAYPLYFILLIPQMKMGAWLFRVPHNMTVSGIKTAYAAGFVPLITLAGASLARAVVVWLLLAPVAAALLFYAIVPVIEAVLRRRQRNVPIDPSGN